ncbi:hypothetical protein C8R47DRAFT_1083268 [Mycena vitilis]|nr:hypothetical protein C8R47DRAFT_1083268 [Mycena vitilis]
MAFNKETHKLELKNGDRIRRQPGESLVKAAERQASTHAPRVMLGMVDAVADRWPAVQSFYQEERERVQREYVSSDDQDASTASESSGSEAGRRVYITLPRKVLSRAAEVQAAERTEPSTRKARRLVIDGVYPPSRPKSRAGEVVDMKEEKTSRPEAPKEPSMDKPFKRPPTPPKPASRLPELTPVEARRVRFDADGDVDMNDPKTPNGNDKKVSGRAVPRPDSPSNAEKAVLKPAGRQSELSSTVDRPGVLNRILDTQVAMSIRELMSFAFLRNDALSWNDPLAAMVKDFAMRLAEKGQIGGRLLEVFLEGTTKRRLVSNQDIEGKRPCDVPFLLLQAIVGTFAALGVLLVCRRARRTGVTQGKEIYKPGDEKPVQYLSRQHFSSPPLPVVSLNASGPIATIEDSVAHQWQKYVDRQPLDVDPTFAVAPQSDYYGSVTLPGGQVLHRSSALNAFRVFRNRETGLPFTLSCHEFTFHIATPDDPQQAWKLELCYPSDARIQRTMQGMTPLDPPGGSDIGFPVHATANPPPMIPMHERLRVNAVRIGHAGTIQWTYAIQTAEHASAEDLLGEQATTVHPPDTVLKNASVRPGTPFPALRPVRAGLSSPTRPLEYTPEVLYHEIRKRVDQDLRLDGDELFTPIPSSELFADSAKSDSSSSDSMPDLVPIPTNDDSLPSPVDLGICGLCFSPQHASTLECPLFGPGTANESGRNGSHETSSEGPAYSLETRRVLDIALGPTMDEWLKLPHEEVSFRSLTAQAQSARKSYEAFIQDFEAKRRIAERPLGGAETAPAQPALGRLTIDTRPIKTASEACLDSVPHLRLDHPDQTLLIPRPTTPPSIDEVSHAARLRAPIFNPHRGPVVTRDEWSSSPPTPETSDCENEDILLKAERVETIPPWSPVVSEWSVENLGDFNPRWVIDEATSRLLRATEDPPTSDSSVDGSTSANEPSYPPSVVDDGDRANQPSALRLPQVGFRDEGLDELQEALYFWTYEGSVHQQDHMRFENEIGLAPAKAALEALHGPLSSFVDYQATAFAGAQSLRQLSPIPLHLLAVPKARDDTPGPKKAASSLDASLPSSTSPFSETNATCPTQSGASHSESAADSMDSTENIGLTTAGSNKRKAPDGETSGPFQEGRHTKPCKFDGDRLRRKVIERRAFQATGLTDYRVIRLFAGVRLAILEAARRVEEMVWHRYGITERSFPNRYIKHALLFDMETAKMQTLWHVLMRNGREQLADAIHELLSIRLRDEFAISHLLNAGYLEDNYPELTSRYWELLYDTVVPAASDVMDDRSEADSTSDIMSLGYPSDDERKVVHFPDEGDDIPFRASVRASNAGVREPRGGTARSSDGDSALGGVPFLHV